MVAHHDIEAGHHDVVAPGYEFVVGRYEFVDRFFDVRVRAGKELAMRKEDRLELKKGRAQPELTPLTRDEVRRLPKVHIGFEQFVEPLAEVAEIYADYLGRGGIDVDEMRAALANYQMLADAHEEAKRRLALIADTRLFNAAKAWKHQLVIYNRARAAGRTNIEIVRAIEKFARFMKPRRRRRGLKAARRTRP